MKEEERLKELRKLKKIFREIEPQRLKIVEKLIENAAFMGASLKELQEEIEENGYIEIYQNGANQRGKKKSSEVEVYNTMIKNYSSVIKQLIDLLPEKGEEVDELLQFIRK